MAYIRNETPFTKSQLGIVCGDDVKQRLSSLYTKTCRSENDAQNLFYIFFWLLVWYMLHYSRVFLRHFLQNTTE